MISVNKKRIVIVGLIVLAALALTVFVLEKTDTINLRASSDDWQTTETGSSVNYGAPTEEEKKAGDKQKEQSSNNTQNNSTDQSSEDKKNVSVIITDAAQYDNIIEVRAFIPDNYRDGTCTITFSKNGESFEKETPAYRDISTTICTNPTIQRSEFSSGGSWRVEVRYDTSDATGTSKSQNIKIN